MTGQLTAESDAIREKVIALVADLAATISDPTQAWDIAVADFNYEVDRLVIPPGVSVAGGTVTS